MIQPALYFLLLNCPGSVYSWPSLRANCASGPSSVILVVGSNRNTPSFVEEVIAVRKIVFVVVGVFVSSVALGRIDNLMADRGFAGPNAFAQDFEDSAETQATHMLPNTAGNYVGELVSHTSGTGTISIDLTQKGPKLGGTFQAAVGGGTFGGDVKGKVKANWDVTLTLFRPGHRCKFDFKGMWTPHSTGNEIAGTYLSKGCAPPDMGMVDAFD